MNLTGRSTKGWRQIALPGHDRGAIKTQLPPDSGSSVSQPDGQRAKKDLRKRRQIAREEHETKLSIC